MFAYSGNNPVMFIDPTGLINFWGVLSGAFLGVLAIASFAFAASVMAAASPLLAVVGSSVLATVGTALTEAAVVTTVGAIAETTVVYDLTVTTGYDKNGCSLLYDFSTDDSEVYLHTGVQNKYEFGASFGSGFVVNYDGPGSYGGRFYDASYSQKIEGTNVGLDICTAPENFCIDKPFEKGTSAILFTSGMSVSLDTNQSRLTYSYDYYWKVN